MIAVKNVYHMLAYAFNALRENEFRNVETESFENASDLFAEILRVGLTAQIKRGLYREYAPKTEPSATIRGKIEFSETLRRQEFARRSFVCRFEEFSPNVPLNRVLKTAVAFLLDSPDVRPERRRALRKTLRYFAAVDVYDARTPIPWTSLRAFRRENATYRALIGVRRLILKSRLLSQTSGKNRLKSFQDDAQAARLYERFVLGYFRRHYPRLRPTARRVYWNLDDGEDDLLPAMRTDAPLTDGTRTLIVDAKWYSRALTGYFGSTTQRSANLYQIFAYVKNLDVERTGNVGGLLLYAKTDEEISPDRDYRMGGNSISVRTLDLTADWSRIERRFAEIVRFFDR